MSRVKLLDSAAWWLLVAMAVVAAAFKFDHPLASALALFPLRWAVQRIAWAADRPEPGDFGQGPDQ